MRKCWIPCSTRPNRGRRKPGCKGKGGQPSFGVMASGPINCLCYIYQERLQYGCTASDRCPSSSLPAALRLRGDARTDTGGLLPLPQGAVRVVTDGLPRSNGSKRNCRRGHFHFATGGMVRRQGEDAPPRTRL